MFVFKMVYPVLLAQEVVDSLAFMIDCIHSMFFEDDLLFIYAGW